MTAYHREIHCHYDQRIPLEGRRLEALVEEWAGGRPYDHRLHPSACSSLSLPEVTFHGHHVHRSPRNEQLFERLSTDIARNVRSNHARERGLDYLEELERRNLPEAEINKVLQSACRLLEASHGAVDGSSRQKAALDLIFDAAHPETISAGNHRTGAIAALQYKMFAEHPGQAAEMIASVALNGCLRAKDGRIIQVPPESIEMGQIERLHYPPRIGERSYASQLFQVAVLNEIGQHRRRPQRYVQSPEPVHGPDGVERDFWQTKDGELKPFDLRPTESKWRAGGISFGELIAECARLGEQMNKNALKDALRDYRPSPVETQCDVLSSVSKPVTQNGDLVIAGPPTITPQKIDEVLKQYHSPAEGMGQYIYDQGVKCGINPAVALAFFVQESSCGTKGIASGNHSWGNIRGNGPGGFRHYANFKEGLDDWYRLIKQQYLTPQHQGGFGCKTLSQVISHYAPSSDRNNEKLYCSNVNNMVDRWYNA
jgi:hypothetical protein